MTKIKNKKQLLKYLDILLGKDKKFKMPSFSEIAIESNFFNKEYKNLIRILNKREINFFENNLLDTVILSTYFSSYKVKKKIKQINNNYLKKINPITKEIKFVKKKIYKDKFI